MKPGEGQYQDLRLAAKAADREKAAEEQWPAFEKRLETVALDHAEEARRHLDAAFGPMLRTPSTEVSDD